MKRQVFDFKPIKQRTRIISFIVDFFLFVFMGMVIFTSIAYPVLESNSGYSSAYQTRDDSYNAMSNMYLDTKLTTLNSKGKPESMVVFNQYLSDKMLNRDYDQNEEYTDKFLYCCINYINEELTYDGTRTAYTVSKVNLEIMEFNQQEDPIFEINESINNPLHLKGSVKLLIGQYISNDITNENSLIYNQFEQRYTKALSKINTLLTTSDQFKSYNISYSTNQTRILKYLGDTTLITYTGLFIVYFLLIPLLLKNGQTFGKKLLKVNVFSSDLTKITTEGLIGKAIASYICYFFLYAFIPYLNIGFGSINFVLFEVSSHLFTAAIPVFVSLIISLINLTCFLKNQDGVSLIDKISYTKAGSSLSLAKEENDNKELYE